MTLIMGIFHDATSVEQGNRMINNAKKNADIAMERFKVQSYNWNKQNKTIMKIYGVSETFVTKMKRTVGIISAKDRCAEARRIFKCHPEHHKLSSLEVANLYDISERTGQTLLYEINGGVKAVNRERLDKIILTHPDFGTPGEMAKIPTAALAIILDVPRHTITTRRHNAGVISYERAKNHRPTGPEKRAYKLCKLTRSWGRAAGIDRYLYER